MNKLVISIKSFLRKYEPLKFYLENILVKYKIMKGGSKYVKFIILARSRTGSTFLEKLLNDHPNIQCEGELLNNLSGRSPKNIINSFFSNKQTSTLAAGYKIFYYHPNDSDSEEVWNLHLKLKNLKVIHLKRSNILRTVLSKQIASKTKQWSINNNSEKIPIEQKQIKLSIDESIEEFEKTRNWENDFDLKFKNHSLIEITYENLTSNTQKELEKVANFLKVKPFKTFKTSIKRQNTEPLEQIITNYQE